MKHCRKLRCCSRSSLALFSIRCYVELRDTSETPRITAHRSRTGKSQVDYFGLRGQAARNGDQCAELRHALSIRLSRTVKTLY